MNALLGNFGSWPYGLSESLYLVGVILAFLASLAASCFGTYSRGKLDQLIGKLPSPRRETIEKRIALHLSEEERKEYAAHAMTAVGCMIWAVGAVLPGYKWACSFFGDGQFGSVEPGAYAGVLTGLVFITCLLTIGASRVVALIAGERILIRYTPLFGVLILPALALERGAEWLDRMVARLRGESAPTHMEDIHEEIGDLVDEGQRGGHLKADAGKMIDRIFTLHEKDVRAVMTPRTDMYCLPVEMALEEAIAKANESGMSRMPVFENTRDSIVGVFYAKDTLKYLDHGRLKTMTLRNIMREPFFIPETRKLDGLLEELQRNKVHIAIVLDEFGGTAGLITVEDIVEEVVGEIVDEYESPETSDTVRVNDHEIVAQGRTPILRVNELLGLALPHDEDYDTIAGYVLAQLGRIPHSGETCDFEPLHIEIMAANPRRIEKLRITKVEPVAASEAVAESQAVQS